MAKDRKKIQVMVSMSPELLNLINGWRRKQLDIPNRSEAVRRLVVFGLKTETRLPADIKRWVKAQLDTSGHRETVPTLEAVAEFLLSLERQ